MFSNTLMQKCIHLSLRALEKQPGRKISLTATLEGRELLVICYWKKSHLQKYVHVSYVNRCGYIREEATCFPYLKAVPTINWDTSFSLSLAPLLHQGSKCRSEDQKEGNWKLPLHAECWCCSCYGCVGALVFLPTALVQAVTRSDHWPVSSVWGKTLSFLSVTLIRLYLIFPNNTCTTKKKHFYNEKGWHQ